MSEAAAATPDNFAAHLEALDTGSDDGGLDQVADSTGPSNDNALSREPQNPFARADGRMESDPEHRVGDDGEPLHAEEGDQEVTDDQPEQQQDARPEGMPPDADLQKMFLKTQEPDLPEFFLDKTVDVPLANGATAKRSVRELISGNMRMADYSRGKQELARERQAVQQERDETRAFLQRLGNPQMLRATIRMLGPQFEQSFHVAAKGYGEEILSFMKMTPAEQAQFKRAVDAERRAEQAEQRARMAQQQPQQPQQQPGAQYVEPIQQSLETHVPGAFEAAGLPPSGPAQQRFLEHFQYLWDGQISSMQEYIQQAVQATAEEFQDATQQHKAFGQQQAPQQAPRPVQQAQQRQALPPPRDNHRAALPPHRVAPSNGAKPPQPAPDHRYRVSGFDDFLRSK